MDIGYELGGRMNIRLNEEDLGSLATRGYCTIRQGLIGSESKTWIRKDVMTEALSATIDGDADLNIDVPIDVPIPFIVSRYAISAQNGDQSMVDWYFHEGSEIVVESV